MLRNLLLLCISLLTLPLFAQPNRTIDGTGNNLTNPDWGAAGSELSTITTNGFTDGMSTPAGASRANPRIISNELFSQGQLLNDPLNLSDFVWSFGQFIDHDITEVVSNSNEPENIMIDFDDFHFNPGNIHPNVLIRMNRSLQRNGTGIGIGNPRKYSNNITHWIDGSSIYGSDDAMASYLRTFVGGKLKTSTGNLLPYNTVDNERGGAIDPTAPHMDNVNPHNDLLFVAGDVRANEQPILLGYHTLFMREHNRLCDELAAENPSWTDEELYQYARKKVGGYIQAITYNEWLPVMGVHVPEYSGYDPTVYPNCSNVFSAAAFRMGHTLLNSNLRLINDDGTDLDSVALKAVFFTPSTLVDVGLDRFLKGMATQVEQNLDSKVIDDIRNFLFGPPQLGLGGLDLASININRGRERGLPDFNTIREDIGLPKYNDFSELTSNQEIATIMSGLYSSIDDVDPWVGMLVENHMVDALFGETIMMIMMQQFAALRDGDRYYYENDPVLSTEDKTEIGSTTLRDIIMRNSNITLMQGNVFLAMPHNDICTAIADNLGMTGSIQTYTGIDVEGATIQMTDASAAVIADEDTDDVGNFEFDEQITCETYYLTPRLEDDIRKGVDVWDLVLMIRHIVGLETFDTPYKYMAADVNNNGDITALDVVDMQRILLFLDDELPNNQGDWQFVPSTFNFVDPANPFSENIPNYAWVDLSEYNMDQEFVAIKTGDVSGNADPNNLTGEGDTRSGETLTFVVDNQKMIAGETYTVEFSIENMDALAAYQYTLDFDPAVLELDHIQPIELENLRSENFVVRTEEGRITTSWYHPNGLTKVEPTTAFALTFTAKTDGELKDLLELNSDLTPAKAFQSNSDQGNVELFFNIDEAIAAQEDLKLFQNKPNPFNSNTTIGFQLPEAMSASLTFYDVTGRTLHQINRDFNGGFNEVVIESSDLGVNGLVFYHLDTEKGSVVKRMIVE